MSQTHGSPVTITKTKSEIESLAEDSDGNVILGSEWIKNLPVGEYTVTETISDSEAMKLANIKAYKPNGFVGDSSLADFDAKKAVELTAVYNSPSDRKDFAAAFSTGTSAITWHIGEHKDGKPSKCSYRDTNFTETVVTNGKKEVDPDKSKNNGKNYLNAQIGKAIFENKVTAGSVEVQKVDNYNHALEGVVFTLHKADNGWNVTGEITELTTTKTEPHSDESPAIVLFKNLKPGSYIIKEKALRTDIFR